MNQDYPRRVQSTSNATSVSHRRARGIQPIISPSLPRPSSPVYPRRMSTKRRLKSVGSITNSFTCLDPMNVTSPSDGSFCTWHVIPRVAAHPYRGSGPSAQPVCHVVSSQLPQILSMDVDSQQSKPRDDGVLSSLNMAIEAMNLAKELSCVMPAQAVFGSVSVLLTMLRVCFLPFPGACIVCSHEARTRWSIKLTMSKSGYLAPMYVGPSTGE